MLRYVLASPATSIGPGECCAILHTNGSLFPHLCRQRFRSATTRCIPTDTTSIRLQSITLRRGALANMRAKFFGLQITLTGLGGRTVSSSLDRGSIPIRRCVGARKGPWTIGARRWGCGGGALVAGADTGALSELSTCL
jgi:hypothetical protein